MQTVCFFFRFVGSGSFFVKGLGRLSPPFGGPPQMQWEKRRDPNSLRQLYVDHSGFAVKPGEISKNVAPVLTLSHPLQKGGFIRAVIKENQWL